MRLGFLLSGSAAVMHETVNQGGFLGPLPHCGLFVDGIE
jgi:hypothetical protein